MAGTLYTSYTYRIRFMDKSKMSIYTICRFEPRYIIGIKNLKSLSPSSQLLSDYKNGYINYTIFRNWYLDEKSREPEFIETIESIKKRVLAGENICLCCVESDRDTCHRKILGEIFEALGLEVKEYITTE